MGAICTAAVVASSQMPGLTNIADASPQDLVWGMKATFRVSVAMMGISTFLFAAALWMDDRRKRN